jgi:hypothetical protein
VTERLLTFEDGTFLGTSNTGTRGVPGGVRSLRKVLQVLHKIRRRYETCEQHNFLAVEEIRHEHKFYLTSDSYSFTNKATTQLSVFEQSHEKWHPNQANCAPKYLSHLSTRKYDRDKGFMWCYIIATKTVGWLHESYNYFDSTCGENRWAVI